MLTKEELKERQDRFTEYQEEYNKTANRNILWEKMYPLIQDAVKYNILKVNKHNFVQNFDDKLGDAMTLLMARYIKKPDYNFRSLVTLAYWAAIYVCRKEHDIHYEQTNSYEELVEEKMLREEHFIDESLGDGFCNDESLYTEGDRYEDVDQFF